MRDTEVVASIVAGDPEGLAAAYDKYAGDLYGYCRSLLQEPNDAADAVQDTFVIAASKVAGLRQPERLRAWLFAVARNECLHRLKSRHRAMSSLQDAPEPADDSADVGSDAERAETVALVRAAVAGLNDGERDVINQLWHGLEVPEVAAALGVSRNHAHSLFSRARDQLEASVGVLLVGRAGRRDCAALDSLLGDWDGRLTARLRKRVGRHIDQCLVCSNRRRQELTPELLYGLAPGAVLAMAALRGVPALTGGGQLSGPLSGVRDAVLRLATDSGPHAVAYRAAVVRSTRSFGMNGFPRPPHHGYLGALQVAHLPVAVVGGTAIAATATVVVTAVVPHHRPAPTAPGAGPPGSGTVGAAPSAPGGTARTGASASPAGPTGPPTAIATGARGKSSARASAPGSTVPTPTSTSTSTLPLTSTPSGGPGPTMSPTVPPIGEPIAGPTAVPSTSAPTAAAPVTVTSSAPPSAPSSTATLSVSPVTVVLTPLLGGSLTLTDSGGPVSWSISEPASLLGSLTVSPSSGTLDAGGSVTVTITPVGLVSLDTQLTVDPGDQVVTVLLGAG
jgi:RNA polymerase sigma factor (sigma-70 family)